MKKYKLIETYPGSGALNDEAIYGNHGLSGDCYQVKTSNGRGIQRFDSEFIEKEPKYWEEIVEKDYEILSFKQNSKIEDLWEAVDTIYEKFARKNDQVFCTKSYTLKQILNNPLYSIHSVKRLSDDEIFTVGDKIRFIDESLEETYPARIIQKLLIKDNTILSINTSVGVEILLKNLTHMKQPLFTTEDGVGIIPKEDGEFQYWSLKLDNWKISNAPHILNSNRIIPTKADELLSVCNELRFSTREAAEEYVLMNKPCLCIKDFKRALSVSLICSHEEAISSLKELVKSKL